jgi:hypothetical protein
MKQTQPQTLRIMVQNIGALRVIVTTVGCVGGLISMEHGTIPTITIRSAEDIINPNPAVKRMLDIAAG